MTTLHFWAMMVGTWFLVAIATTAVCYALFHPDAKEGDQ